VSEPTFRKLLDSVRNDEGHRRNFAQNALIVDVAVALNRALETSGLRQCDLAARLGRSEGFVSQVLSGGANITLKTLGDFAYGLDCIVDVVVRPQTAIVIGNAGNSIQTLWHSTPLEPSEAADTQLALAA